MTDYSIRRERAYINNSCLRHYGVKGMKWGVRKDASSRGGKISSAADKIASQSRSVKKQTAKAKTLSDDELRSAINRMRLEQDYVNMSKSKMSAGEKFLKGAVSIGGTAVKVAAQQATTIMVKSAINAAARAVTLPFDLVLR